MTNTKFNQGDIVKMKSGSPEMTVSYSDENETHVVYYNFTDNKVSPSIKLKTCVLELVS